MKDIPEYIICSAIWYKDLELKNERPLRLRGISPYNIDKGIVFCGWRHPNCLYQMVAITGLRQCEAGEEIQGFLTSKNRFLNRKEAAILAFERGQIDKIYEGQKLYSEDVW